MSLEHVTLLFLVGIFVSAEIFRARRGMRGVIVSADDSSIGPVALPVMTVKVKLDRGDEVTASLNCCTACLGRLNVGDQVRVADSRDGYVIDLPWFQRKQCPARGSTHH